MSGLRTVALLLIAAAVLTLALHFAGVPEDIYRWLYHHLLSGLEVPDDPSQGTVDAVGYVSLIGGILELAGGTILLGVDERRRRQPRPEGL
jgi:hypothetical protein